MFSTIEKKQIEFLERSEQLYKRKFENYFCFWLFNESSKEPCKKNNSGCIRWIGTATRWMREPGIIELGCTMIRETTGWILAFMKWRNQDNIV